MKKRFTEEQIIGFLREAEAGMSVAELCRKHAFSEASYYLWRSKFGGMNVSDAKRLKELETENIPARGWGGTNPAKCHQHELCEGDEMAKLSKDQLRMMHGITEPTGPSDPRVLSRRRMHEAVAKWLARWSYPLQGLFASIGLVFVLLPTMSKSWRSVVETMPIAGRIFQDFSSLSGSAMLLFYFLSGLFLIQTRVQSKNPAGQASFLTYRDIVEMELYPKNKGEEIAYWVDFCLTVTGTTLWLYLPFGILAFAIRMGG